MTDNILRDIDDTLTFYSAGLDQEISVPMERTAGQIFTDNNFVAGNQRAVLHMVSISEEVFINSISLNFENSVGISAARRVLTIPESRDYQFTVEFNDVDGSIVRLLIGDMIWDRIRRLKLTRLRRMRNIYRRRHRYW